MCAFCSHGNAVHSLSCKKQGPLTEALMARSSRAAATPDHLGTCIPLIRNYCTGLPQVHDKRATSVHRSTSEDTHTVGAAAFSFFFAGLGLGIWQGRPNFSSQTPDLPKICNPKGRKIRALGASWFIPGSQIPETLILPGIPS